MSGADADANQTRLLQLIRDEACNAVACHALAQLFKDYNDSLASVFRKMAASEQRHATILKWFYRLRFGPFPSARDTPKTDHKPLDLALKAGMRRQLKKKIAEKQRQRWLRFWQQDADGETG